MKYIGWPEAALIFAVIFIFVFRKAIISLLVRIRKISKGDIQANGVMQIQEDKEKKHPRMN